MWNRANFKTSQGLRHMSMPGFVFHFECDTCARASDDYCVFPFPDIWRPQIHLPARSREHECWGEIRLDLTSELRSKLESDPRHLLDFAASLSTERLVVYVASLISGSDVFAVSVVPEPVCPHCDRPCRSVWGYPPDERPLGPSDIAPEELDMAPLSAIDLSVRTRQICSQLNIRTIGQLRKRRDDVANRSVSNDATAEEIDRWLSLGE